MTLDQIEDIYELSPLQQGFLFHTLYTPDTRAYFEQFVWTLRGELSSAAFERAWQQVVAHHPILRSSFHWQDLDNPVQAVHQEVTLPIALHDWRAVPDAEQPARLESFLATDRALGFDLEQPPLMRLALIQIGANAWYLVWSYHHLLLDGWSMSALLKDVFLAYEAARHGRTIELEPVRPYGDYIDWLQQQDLAATEAFWRATLKGFSAPTPLIAGQPDSPTDPEQRFHEQRFQLSQPTTAALQALARQHQITLSTIFQAAWALLLHRYSGEDDVVFGTTVSGRPADLVGFASMIGLFINTLPLRVKLPAGVTLLGWLKQLQAHQFDLRDYEHSSLVQVQGWSDVPRGLPLFESIVVFENFPLDRALPELSRSLEIEWARTVQHSNYPLTVMAIPAPELQVRVSYDRQRFDAATIERMQAHLSTILQSIAAQPEQPLSQVALLTPAEKQQLLAWNAITAGYAIQTPIHALFAAQAAQTPDAVALIFEAGTGEHLRLTYHELNQRANQLAHELRARGVGADTPVAIYAERSPELVVALLGTWKAGGVCVPLDPTYPQERLRFMLSDMQAPILLTQRPLVDRLPSEHGQILCLDTDWQTIAEQSRDEPQSHVGGENLAYMIYTSGTTGTPKAVQVEHRNLVNTLLAGQTAFTFAPGTIMPCIASFSFDIAFFELLSPLLLGGTTMLMSRQQVLDLPGFARSLQDLTTLHTLPSLMRQIIDFAQSRRQTYPAIKQVLVGGDLVPPDLLRDMQAVFPAAQIYVAYGPTETAILCSAYAVPPDQPPHKHLIGKPLPNTLLRIYDHEQRLVPIGVAGELYIGGAGVTRGYLNRPELNGEKFVTIDGERFYRSGDLARYQPDGTIEFLGRIDGQVKIRGFRIELGEIEAVLATHPQVSACVVVARDEQRGDKRLVAYVTEEPRTKNQEPNEEQGNQGTKEQRTENREQRNKDAETDSPPRLPQPRVPSGRRLGEVRGRWPGGEGLTTESLRTFLAARLPEYMLPSAFVTLDALPLSPNGKVDRKALPEPEARRPETASYLAPQTAIEREIAQIWQEVLQLERVGRHDNFFDLGGHSIRMMQAYGKLVERLDREIAMVDLFRYPTVAALAQHLAASPTEAPAEPDRATERPAFKDLAPLADTDIAIIGMSGRFPGAPDVEAFWHNLRDGKESISFFTDEELQAAGVAPEVYSHPDYVKAGAILQDIELFDAGFFGYSPREAAIMDPQQRFFLESVWEALEHAGYNPDSASGPIGVFAGVGTNTYLLHNLYANQELLEAFGGFQTMILNEKDHLTTRVSYKLNLRGPSINLQTACSTSLVATVVACQNLLLRQCDIALAGGVTISVPHIAGYRYHEGGVTSPDGHCRAFDAQGLGTISGNGVGVVVLKRLADALRDGDHVHAVIKGFALNNDGGQKVGYTAPGVDGQAEVIATALAMAGVAPETISYVEAHGTATPLGDPIEIAALTRAFQTQSQKPGWCAIGSVKTNVGHLDAASGVAGLIKAVMALEHRQIPPSLHFERPNPLIDFASSPFAVNTALTEWPRHDTPRRAGVSSFGIGGTNAHVVLEEAPPQPAPEPSRDWQILTLSARSDAALAQAAQRLSAHLRCHPELDLADVAYTLHVGRKSFTQRQMFVCRSLDEAIELLELQSPEKVLRSSQEQQDRPVVFMFPGQGAQYITMARDLYTEEPVFREHLDRCAELLLPHLNLDLRELLYPDADREAAAARELSQTRLTQPALFAVEYALAQLWIAWGITPQAMLGHSLGEYVAATLAGVFSLEDALRLIAQRAAMIQELPSGAMLSVSLPEAEIRPLLDQDLSLALVNAPNICVVAGPHAAIERLESQLRERGVDCRRVHTSHAFHSAMMDPILDAFTEYVSSMELHPPAIPYLSSVSGTWISAAEATDPRYWTRHLRETVRFADNLQTLLAESDASPILLEVGPGRMLGTLARQYKLTNPAALASLRHPHDQQSDAAFLLSTLGQLWLVGAPVDWQRLYAGERRRRVVLPTYPFERQRYWIEPPARAHTGDRTPAQLDAASETEQQSSAIAELHPRPELLTPFVAPSTTIEQAIAAAWQDLLGVGPIGIHDNFFDLGGHSLMATQIIARLRDVFPIELPVSDLFDAATIAQLAALVEARLIEKLDDLTEEEARLLI
ncbi:MAG TPA: amino acid adenylation domain-containing protein [Herpetosiphonaceae bacterium]